MREIRFRGKRIDNGKWVYGGYLLERDGQVYIARPWLNGSKPLEWLVDRKTVGEWTGLTDKNKVDVYGGDILARPYGEMGVCVWDERQAGYYLKMLNGEFEGRHLPLIAENVEHHEVIAGNVHDNPELLEGSHAD